MLLVAALLLQANAARFRLARPRHAEAAMPGTDGDDSPPWADWFAGGQDVIPDPAVTMPAMRVFPGCRELAN